MANDSNQSDKLLLVLGAELPLESGVNPSIAIIPGDC